jgi:hypothetical protein
MVAVVVVSAEVSRVEASGAAAASGEAADMVGAADFGEAGFAETSVVPVEAFVVGLVFGAFTVTTITRLSMEASMIRSSGIPATVTRMGMLTLLTRP